ncbi:MAG TPA: hypothetical protein ENI05_06055 [Porticoccus sp.]|nr:hypothetical protein [Porticoccus sp.]
MPVVFELHDKDGYFTAKWTEKLGNEDILGAYKKFIGGEQWSHSLNELTDLSQADLENITNDGMIELQIFAEQVYRKNNTAAVKVAVYCPNGLPNEMARIYEAWSGRSPEYVRMFKNIQAAETWLRRQ